MGGKVETLEMIEVKKRALACKKLVVCAGKNKCRLKEMET